MWLASCPQQHWHEQSGVSALSLHNVFDTVSTATLSQTIANHANRVWPSFVWHSPAPFVEALRAERQGFRRKVSACQKQAAPLDQVPGKNFSEPFFSPLFFLSILVKCPVNNPTLQRLPLLMLSKRRWKDEGTAES